MLVALPAPVIDSGLAVASQVFNLGVAEEIQLMIERASGLVQTA